MEQLTVDLCRQTWRGTLTSVTANNGAPVRLHLGLSDKLGPAYLLQGGTIKHNKPVKTSEPAT